MDTDKELTDAELNAAIERVSAQMDAPVVKEWLAIRKKAGLTIDTETAEVDWCYAQTLDPYLASLVFPARLFPLADLHRDD